MEAATYSPQFLAAASIACALLGLALGFLAGRRSSSADRKYREAERRLDQVLQDKKRYEDEVVEHFSRTAELLNNLTASYRDVHNHLAAGAGTLCQGRGPVSLESMEALGDTAEIPPNLLHIQPPLDYAPKGSPDETGMLNEEFGIDRQPRRGLSREAENV